LKNRPRAAAKRTAWTIAALMCAASVGAIVAEPDTRLADERPPIALASMVPAQFGDWRELPASSTQVVNPQAQELLDKLYSEVLTRVYVNARGYRIMLSIAYGSDQSRALQAHKPEVCYPAQGFVVQSNDAGQLPTPFGAIPVRRLYAIMGPRHEPVTYWFTVGDRVVRSQTEKRIADLRLGLTGRIPDGLLFRVSSIDTQRQRAYEMQQDFVNQLLQTVSADARKRLSGLAVPQQL
jgi:EpsI family protein